MGEFTFDYCTGQLVLVYETMRVFTCDAVKLYLAEGWQLAPTWTGPGYELRRYTGTTDAPEPERSEQ